MTGIPEVEAIYEQGVWLHECLDVGDQPSTQSLRDTADVLQRAADRIEDLLTQLETKEEESDVV